MPEKPDTIFQEIYDKIKDWQPSDEMKETLNNMNEQLGEVIKKIVEKIAETIINALKKKME